MLTQKIKNIKLTEKFKYIFLSLIVLLIIICFTLNPKVYMFETLNGAIVFIKNVFPALFPFFVFSKILTGLNCVSDFSMLFKNITTRLFNTPGISAYVFFMSIISGYPVGAKVVSELYSENLLSETDVERVITFTSTSGPLFVIGTVGVGLLNSFKCGLIMLSCHILASLINGLIYRKHKLNNNFMNLKYKSNFTSVNINKVINESVYNSIISISLVGAYIIIFFVLIAMINNLGLFKPIIILLNKLKINKDISNAYLNGIVELTHGCIDISKLNLSLKLKTILCGSLISFGGLSVAFQGFAFLHSCKVKFSYFIKQKISHAAISVLFLIVLCCLI